MYFPYLTNFYLLIWRNFQGKTSLWCDNRGSQPGSRDLFSHPSNPRSFCWSSVCNRAFLHATLRIKVSGETRFQFSFFRYLMYYWPGLSATIGVITFFYFLLMIALFSWYRFLKWQGQSDDDDSLIIEKPTPIKEIEVKSPIPLKQTSK